MKLWDKGYSTDQKIDIFTVGNDRDLVAAGQCFLEYVGLDGPAKAGPQNDNVCHVSSLELMQIG